MVVVGAGYTASAEILSPTVNITVDGKTYAVPQGNEKRKNDLYYLKKAIEDGDQTAREIVLGGFDEKYIYIGNEEPLWLRITDHGDAEIVTP